MIFSLIKNPTILDIPLNVDALLLGSSRQVYENELDSKTNER